MRGSRVRRATSLICGTSLLLGIGPGAVLAMDPVAQSRGQTIYAAAYSYVHIGSGGRRFPITPTLVIRNTDPVSTIILTAVDYRDSKGEHLHHYVDEPVVAGPLASTEFAMQERYETEGHSPSFIVRWKADEPVNAPVVEVLLIGGRGSYGISLIGRAWVIEDAGTAQNEAVELTRFRGYLTTWGGGVHDAEDSPAAPTIYARSDLLQAAGVRPRAV